MEAPLMQKKRKKTGPKLLSPYTQEIENLIKNTYLQMASANDQEWMGKAAIMGALNLYLDFLNMFMFLLQFLGQNRN